jgi:hypothetical protein
VQTHKSYLSNLFVFSIKVGGYPGGLPWLQAVENIMLTLSQQY